MKRMPWSMAALATLMTVLLGLSACSSSSSSDGSNSSTPSAAPKAGGSLTVGLEASWVSLDPIKATTFDSNDVLNTIYETLLDVDKKGKTSSGLASGFTVSPDGLTYTIIIKPGIKFQDGTALDAQAVKTNLDRYRDPKNACTCFSTVKTVTSVAVSGPLQVIITLSAPNSAFPVMALGANAGLMVSPAALQKNPADVSADPVGTGPFVFASQVSGSSVTVKRWDQYREAKRPYLDSITFKVITDQNARYSSLQSGAIDIADNISYNSVSPAKSESSLKVVPQGAAGTAFVQFQLGADSPLKDPAARAAACMAINPKAIADTLFDGVPKTGVQSQWPIGSAYDPGKVPGYSSYDIAKAKSAVKDLVGLSFELETNTAPDNVSVAQALQAQWKAAGINVTIKQTDPTTNVSDLFSHKFQAILSRWRGSLDPDGNVNIFMQSALAVPGKPTTNFGLVNDPEVDKLINQGVSTSDVSKRRQTYKELAKTLASVTPYCYLWNGDFYRAMKTVVYGIPVSPDNVMDFTDAYING